MKTTCASIDDFFFYIFIMHESVDKSLVLISVFEKRQDYNDLSSSKSTTWFGDSGVSYLNDHVVQCVQQRDHIHEGLCFKNLSVKKQFEFKNLLWRNRFANKTRTCRAEMRGTYLAV